MFGMYSSQRMKVRACFLSSRHSRLEKWRIFRTGKRSSPTTRRTSFTSVRSSSTKRKARRLSPFSWIGTNSSTKRCLRDPGSEETNQQMSTNAWRMFCASNRTREEQSRERQAISSTGSRNVDSSSIDLFSFLLYPTRLLTIQGNHVQSELIDRIEHLPELCKELVDPNQTSSIISLKPALQFYTDFIKYFHSASATNDEDFLPVTRYLIENGNTTVYRWRTGRSPVSVERPSFNYKFAETIKTDETHNQDQENLILGLDDIDDDLTKSIQDIEVKQTSDQTDTIDFGSVRLSGSSWQFTLISLSGRRNRLVSNRHRSWTTCSIVVEQRSQPDLHIRSSERSCS